MRTPISVFQPHFLEYIALEAIIQEMDKLYSINISEIRIS